MRERAPYTAAERNVEFTEVAGRHGALMIDRGTFKQVQEEVPVYLFASDRATTNIRAEANELFSWLKSARGWCELTYSDDARYFMKATVAGELSFQEVFYLFYVGEGAIPFIRQPQRYVQDGRRVRTITTKGTTLTNPEQFESQPKITVYGTGDITLYVGNKIVVLKGVTDPITLDTEMGNSYTSVNGIIVPANQKVSNALPNLGLGDTAFDWIGNVTKIEVVPRWWTI
ncbi:hypothetical protein HB818_14095 [Listeria booriae]|uniref:hypothetical protein n=1 Tax=Listeria booriae TaxID=1552123 RepID=UPI0016256BFD|nr:hypothetical protein [Listeria booriae]MBC1286892.1 hypothetical protein [Listeria booriae]